MTSQQIRQKILKFSWEPWLERPFFAFMLSTFKGGNSKKSFKKLGLSGWEYLAYIFSSGQWYQAEEVYENTSAATEKWFKKYSISEITSKLDKFYLEKKERIKKLAKEPNKNTRKIFQEIAEILSQVTTYIWAAHILENIFLPRLKKETAKYISTEIDKFIGDASFPSKKNALEKMEEEIKRGVDFRILAKKYGWMRTRDGFAEPYTPEEIAEHAKEVKEQKIHHKYPKMPKPLKKFFAEARELVYFRTERTDVYYELLFLARPIFKEVASQYRIPWSELKYYTIQSLLDGHPKKYSKNFSCIGFKEKQFYFEGPIIIDRQIGKMREIRGSIAQTGIARGAVKVVKKVKELKKVKTGDILVTYMTAPHFLPAMKLAAGFVTDEGGLTCHAAIVAREMKKPCIIGTKIATKVLRDGDLVEVDATKGVVKIIKHA
jgi:phosphohistidine swiveling domain-containing protein